MHQKYFCGLDIGVHTVKAGVLEVGDNKELSLLGVYEAKTSGFSGGSVTDLGELSLTVDHVISELSTKTGVRIKDVQLGIGGDIVQKRYSSTTIPLVDRGNKIITKQDVGRIIQQARLLGVKMDEIVLADFPQMFKVDDVNTALNPIGLFGRKLEVSTLVFVANNTIVKNLTKAVHQAGYDVVNVFFTSIAAAEGSLNDYQKRQGAVVLDIGSTVTDMLIFKGGGLRSFETIAMGGSDITAALSEHLQLSYDLAEDIKQSYANVSGGSGWAEEEVLIKRDEGYWPVKKGDINRAIEPEVARFLDACREKLAGSGYGDQINIGIFVAGGGAFLTGLPERIEQMARAAVKLAGLNFPVKRMHNAAKFLSAIGLAQAGFRKAYGLDAPEVKGGNPATMIGEKLKELYQEYF